VAHAASAAPEKCDLREEVGSARLELLPYQRIANSPAANMSGSVKAPFYPITGIYFVQGRFSARTFGGDYFPARLVRMADGELRLDQLTYRVSVPGGPRDEF